MARNGYFEGQRKDELAIARWCSWCQIRRGLLALTVGVMRILLEGHWVQTSLQGLARQLEDYASLRNLPSITFVHVIVTSIISCSQRLPQRPSVRSILAAVITIITYVYCSVYSKPLLLLAEAAVSLDCFDGSAKQMQHNATWKNLWYNVCLDQSKSNDLT